MKELIRNLLKEGEANGFYNIGQYSAYVELVRHLADRAITMPQRKDVPMTFRLVVRWMHLRGYTCRTIANRLKFGVDCAFFDPKAPDAYVYGALLLHECSSTRPNWDMIATCLANYAGRLDYCVEGALAAHAPQLHIVQ